MRRPRRTIVNAGDIADPPRAWMDTGSLIQLFFGSAAVVCPREALIGF